MIVMVMFAHCSTAAHLQRSVSPSAAEHSHHSDLCSFRLPLQLPPRPAPPCCSTVSHGGRVNGEAPPPPPLPPPGQSRHVPHVPPSPRVSSVAPQVKLQTCLNQSFKRRTKTQFHVCVSLVNARLAQCFNSVLNVKVVLATFNQEKALVQQRGLLHCYMYNIKLREGSFEVLV